MKLEDLFEQTNRIGVVVSVNHDGSFYDIAFVDYDTQDTLTGHYKNLGQGFVNVVREMDAWDQVYPFFKRHFKGQPLGEEYSAEDADFVLFGPISEQQFNMLTDTFEREVRG